MTPFILAHELIHAKYGDKLRHCDNDILSCEEKRANKEAIILLWEIYKEQGGNASYFSNFIEIAGCPFLESITILQQLEAIEESLEESFPTFERNLQRCAIISLDLMSLKLSKYVTFLRYIIYHTIYTTMPLMSSRFYQMTKILCTSIRLAKKFASFFAISTIKKPV